MKTKILAFVLLALSCSVQAKQKCHPVVTTSTTTPKPCQHIMKCPLGQKWDKSDKVCACVPIVCESCAPCKDGFVFNEDCVCVNSCPDVSCTENFIIDENCDCICGLNETSCQEFEVFNADDCRCYPNLGCDYIMECPLGQRWDNCGCIVNECPLNERCKEGKAFDTLCECQCIESGEDCDGFWDSQTCSCIPDGCDFIDECPIGLRWDLDVCNCVAIECPGVVCGENNVFDEQCDCQCGIDDSACEANEYFDPEKCACFPYNTCDFIEDCPPWEQWNGETCACDPKPEEP